MTMQAHIQQLLEKHANLDHAIEEETQRPHPDNILINELKKQKLRIKDEINRLQLTH
jgi:hypothetical protein